MNGRLRTVAAGMAGIITWPGAATVGNRVFCLCLDGCRQAEPAMAFNASRLVGRLLVGMLASLATGVVARFTAGRSGPAPEAAGIVLLAAFFPVHIGLWSRFPVAYHLCFVSSLVAVPPLGARAVDRIHR